VSGPDFLAWDEPLPPRRLDPRTILVRGLQGSPSAILGIPVLLAWSRGEGLPLAALAAGVVLLLGIMLFASWLRWRTFTYQILPGQLVIARGLVHRTRRSIPAERIQDVSIKQGPVSRLFGLAEVRVETGSGEADEGRLDSVSLSEAHRLREVLRSLRAQSRGGEAGREGGAGTHAEEDDVEAALFAMGLPRLLGFGLFNFSLVWIAAILGGLQYLDQALGYGWDRWLELAGVAERELQSRVNASVILGVSATAIALGLVAGIVRTVLKYHGFTLAHAGARFRYRRGLLTRTEVVVAKRQIQLGLVERGAVSGRLGWSAFKVQTLGSSDEASGRQELVPFARDGETAPIIALAGLPSFEAARLGPVSRWHGLGGLVGFVAAPALILGGAAVFFPPAGLGLLVLPLPLVVALLRRRYHRYALAGTSVQVARGVLTRRDWTVPYGNVQAITVRRGPVQRWLGIATVRIDTAGARGLHRPHVHDLDQADAAAFLGDLTERVNALGTATRPEGR
jgi:putative membrane protein